MTVSQLRTQMSAQEFRQWMTWFGRRNQRTTMKEV